MTNREKLLWVLGSTLLALGIAEWLLRYLPPDLSSMRQLIVLDASAPMGYRLHRNASVDFTGMYEFFDEPVLWQTNDQAFRRDAETTTTTERFRIMTFGDSDTFGWSVDLEETFQAQMETKDPGIEVLNFGIPGYNATDIVDYMERTIFEHQPHMVLYLANKNDFDLPLRLDNLEASSALLLRLRFLYQVTIAKPERIRIRHSAERRQLFVDELIRMTELVEKAGAIPVVGFIKWSDWSELPEIIGANHPVFDLAASGRLRIINTQPAFIGQPRIDEHISPPGYASLANLLCEALAGGSGGCMPDGTAAAR